MAAETDLREALLRLEKQYWTAIMNKDVPAATALSDDACLVVGAQGVAQLDRKKLAGMLQAAQFELHHCEILDFHVHALTQNVAIVGYQVKEALVVEGKTLALDAFDASVWIQRDGTWLCALHTESLAGDPFGRQ